MSTTTPGMLDLVDGFDGPYRFLSNYVDSPLCWEGAQYATAEAAFAAGKTLEPEQRAWIAAASSPGEAKRRGRRVHLRPGWDELYRYEVMAQVLAAKFSDAGLRQRLVETGTALLVEANTWHDQDWGCCRCPTHRATPGRNCLGRALMQLRDQLTAAPADRWVRVACTGHRPQHLPAGSQHWVTTELRRIAGKLIAEHGMRVAISGGAMGSDLWWADAAHEAGAKIWVYQPFPQQPDRWSADWQQHHQRVRATAARVATLAQTFSVTALHARSDWMIRDCSALVAVVDPEHTHGGTYQALRKALSRRPVIYLDVRARDTRLVVPKWNRLLPTPATA
jgi:ribA/ribD-fused uncharacterized protein